MKRYPYVKQEGYKDCAAASLLMIIKYYKGNLPIEEVRELTKTTKNGATAFHIIEAAKEIGFDCKGVKCKFEDITVENLVLPCIINIVINKSYYHFVVLYEINFKKGYVILGDPSDGIKKVNFDVFKTLFNNVMLFLTPNKILPNNDQENSLKLIFSTIKGNSKLIINIVILSLLVIIFSIVGSFYTQFMYDAFSTSFSKSYLLFLFILFFSIAFLRVVSSYFREKILIILNQKIDLELTMRVFNSIINLPYRYYHNHNTGEIVSKINDLSMVREIISKLSLTMFVDLPLIIVSLLCLFFINNTLFIFSLIVLILYVLLMICFHYPLSKKINEIQVSKERVNNKMVETISGFESVKGINIESIEKIKFEKIYICFLKKLFNVQNISCLQNILKEFLNTISYLIIILIGLILAIDNKISVGQLFTFNALLNYFLNPIQNIVELDLMFKEALNSLRRINGLMIEKKDNGFIKYMSKYEISINNLSYTFDNKKQILNNINMIIPQSSKVMIVGTSGGGKSTLFKILMRYYNIAMDKVYIGGIDLNNYKEDTLRRNISYISQNETLFNDTIYKNLKLDMRVDDNDLLKVINICELNDVISSSELGLNRMVEENGFNFSGGERQRLVLARTLLRKRNIIIIDEGLSEVDVNLERKILKNMFLNYNKKTIIVISHRLENLDLFDKLIEINNGVVSKEIIKNV